MNEGFRQFFGDIRVQNDLKQLRRKLFNEARYAIKYAINEIVTRNREQVKFRDGPTQHIIQHDGAVHQVQQNGQINGQQPDEYTQNVKLYGHGAIKLEYSIMWKNRENEEKIEYISISFFYPMNKYVYFKQEIVYTESDGTIITIEQTNKQKYNINN
uniref:DUF3883 domain-containing protein n=1 Tax=Meloidogyne hapla TaxID=6305 RepID=A0A1I8BRZ2_MELHA